eukprot:CAMPEP_0181202728 /NCGR_PEP_ID=MMETSP1096-20121128/19005_1 /TAXON_ID=156174 ORGANISM="Chrysochromulina ericina, Strain CCMP281" /NCGR_SAMPLE_ID=MMETSP1096 /ASSEMBLY_ACC=CAM_ASM_000453 /LENGTH=102 /DNA_ID=CAMNT_0023293277 /DNA_START=1610 /DNA_END=1918 /DNA_ORIENTATION=+
MRLPSSIGFSGIYESSPPIDWPDCCGFLAGAGGGGAGVAATGACAGAGVNAIVETEGLLAFFVTFFDSGGFATAAGGMLGDGAAAGAAGAAIGWSLTRGMAD